MNSWHGGNESGTGRLIVEFAATPQYKNIFFVRIGSSTRLTCQRCRMRYKGQRLFDLPEMMKFATLARIAEVPYRCMQAWSASKFITSVSPDNRVTPVKHWRVGAVYFHYARASKTSAQEMRIPPLCRINCKSKHRACEIASA
jgi:hypothetical protein